MFSGEGQEDAAGGREQGPGETETVIGSRILEDVDASVCQVPESGNRTGEVASDGISYDESTESYIRLLQRVNCSLCQQAEEAYEVVYTIPVCLKKKPEEPAVGKESL